MSFDDPMVCIIPITKTVKKQALRTEKKCRCPLLFLIVNSCSPFISLVKAPKRKRRPVEVRLCLPDRHFVLPTTPKGTLLHHTSSLFLLLALAGLLQHLLDDLLLLNEESTDDTVPDAVTASGATVCALDSLLGLGDLSVLAGAQGRDLRTKSQISHSSNVLVSSSFCLATVVLYLGEDRRAEDWRVGEGRFQHSFYRVLGRQSTSPANQSSLFPCRRSWDGRIVGVRLVCLSSLRPLLDLAFRVYFPTVPSNPGM